MLHFNYFHLHSHCYSGGDSPLRKRYTTREIASGGIPTVAINGKRRSVRQLSLTSAVEDGFWEGRRPFRKAAGTARRQAREGAAGAGRTDLRAGDKRSLRLWHKPQLSSTKAPTQKRVSGRVCGIYGVQRQRNGINHTVSPIGRDSGQS